jgi:hypothetical protein
MARGEGGVATASSWLKRGANNWHQDNGRWVKEPELSGWFVRLCHEAGCGWFVPMVYRLAADEDVPLAEIEAAYRANNGGREMPSGTFFQVLDIAREWPHSHPSTPDGVGMNRGDR